MRMADVPPINVPIIVNGSGTAVGVVGTAAMLYWNRPVSAGAVALSERCTKFASKVKICDLSDEKVTWLIVLTFPAKSEDSSERWCYDRVDVMTEME
jgi:hypothetical protein